MGPDVDRIIRYQHGVREVWYICHGILKLVLSCDYWCTTCLGMLVDGMALLCCDDGWLEGFGVEDWLDDCDDGWFND